jgi:hypothetical protein
LHDYVAESQIQIDDQRNPVLEGVDKTNLLKEFWLLHSCREEKQGILGEGHRIQGSIAFWFEL